MGKVNFDSPVGGQPAPLPVEDQMTDILNNPRMSENAKVAELEKAFANLSDPEKQAMYERLKDRKSSDPLAKQFHYRLSHSPGRAGQLSSVDRALKALNPNHGQPANGGNAPKSPPPGTGPSPAVMDPKTMEKILGDSLRRQEKEQKKTDFGPEIQVWTKDIVKTPEEKVAIVRSRLENASKEDLQKIISESANWPEESKKIVNEAMRGSQTVMKRIATEFPPDAQAKAMDRFFDSSGKLPDNHPLKPREVAEHKAALGTWMEHAPKEALNKVMSNHPAAIDTEVLNQIKSGRFGVFDKLQPNLKTYVLEGLTKPPIQLNTGILNVAFKRMSPYDKNKVIDDLQLRSPDSLPKVLTILAPDWTKLEGLNKENAQAIRDAYLSMADRAKTKEEGDLYRKNADYLKNWMEESFKQR